MDFTSNSHPTRFISMAACSLDNSLLASTSTNNTPRYNTVSNVPEKQYIDQNPVLEFQQNMNNLENEFEKVRDKLTFSTNSLQSTLQNVNNQTNNQASSLSPNHSNTQSLSNEQSMLPNITSTPLPNTSMPLPSSPKPATSPTQKISSIGSAIDERLQNLRAKLYKLEQEQDDELDLTSDIKLKSSPISNFTFNETPTDSFDVSHNHYRNQDQNPVNRTWEDFNHGTRYNTHTTEDTAMSLPLITKDPLNTSFAVKYQKYMQKYHGHDAQELEKSRNETQNMLSKIQEKSKALFQTNIDYHDQQKRPSSVQYKNKENQILNENKPFIVDESEKKLYEKCVSNFDEQLNTTWDRTQKQLKKLQNMSDYFKRTTCLSTQTQTQMSFDSTTSNSTHELDVKPKAKQMFAMDQSIASSHWTLDSQPSQSLHIQPKLKVVNEDSELSIPIPRKLACSQSMDLTSLRHSLQREKARNFDVSSKNQEISDMDSTKNAEPESVSNQNVINLSFNRGIQVRIPIVCKHCNKTIDADEVKVITLENEHRVNDINLNDCKPKPKQIECSYEDEEKRQCITFENTKGNDGKSNKQLNISRDMIVHHEVCSKTYEELSRSCSWSSFKENSNTMNVDKNGGNDDEERGTAMSEHDRKQLIMDLKSIDGDCQSDGYLLHERKRINNKNRFAKNMLSDNPKKTIRNKSVDHSHDGKRRNTAKRSNTKSSLRAKLNELRMSMDGNGNRNQMQENYASRSNHDEYDYLRRKLKIYEDRLRNIDPSLLE